MTVLYSTVQFLIQEYNQAVKGWLYWSEFTTEEGAKEELEEARRIYPKAKYRLIKIEKVSTLIEGEVS